LCRNIYVYFWAYRRGSDSRETALLDRTYAQKFANEFRGTLLDGLYITHSRAYWVARKVTVIDVAVREYCYAIGS
jgi:hypothetical protein